MLAPVLSLSWVVIVRVCVENCDEIWVNREEAVLLRRENMWGARRRKYEERHDYDDV